MDEALGQSLLQFIHAHPCYFGVEQVKMGELLQLGHVLESRVGDFGVLSSLVYSLYRRLAKRCMPIDAVIA